MKHVNASCKFCGRPLTLRVDEEYDEVGDAFKLMKLGACNRCADLRVKRRTLTYAILNIAATLQADRRADTVTAARAGLERLTKLYLQMVADWTNTPALPWEESMVDAIVKDPTNIGNVIGRFWPEKQNQPQML